MPILQNCGKQWPYFTKSREGNWWGRGYWVFTLEWWVINRFHGNFFCLQYVRLCLEIYLRWLEYSWPIPNSCPPEPQTATIQEFLQMDSKAIVQRWDDLGLEKTWNKRTVVTDTKGKKKMCKDRQKSERWNFKLERERRKWDQEGAESRFFSEPPEKKPKPTFTLTLDFRPPELWQNKFGLSQDTSLMTVILFTCLR